MEQKEQSNALPKEQSYTLQDGRELTIKQFSAFDLFGVAQYVNSIVHKIYTTEHKEELNHFTVISLCRDEVFAILAEATGLTLDEAKNLDPEDALVLTGIVYEVNSGFFTRLGGLALKNKAE